MADHKRFTLAIDVKIYSCDPQRPWQRDSHKNVNVPLRRHLPKEVDLSVYIQAQLNAVAKRLNERPRKRRSLHPPVESAGYFVEKVWKQYDTLVLQQFGKSFQTTF